MSLGLGNTLRQSKRPAGGGGGVTGANNGLDLDGANAVLGQSLGEAGNPAALLSTREIPLNGFILQGTSAAFVNFAFSNLAWDIKEQNTGTGIAGVGSIVQIDAPNQFLYKSSTDAFLNLNPSIDYYAIGDIDASLNGTFLEIDDSQQLFRARFNTIPYMSLDVNLAEYYIGDYNIQQDGAYYLAINTGGIGQSYLTGRQVNIGDIDNLGNQTQIALNDGVQTVQILANGKSGFADSPLGTSYWLAGSLTSMQFGLGDLDGLGNSTKFEIDDANISISASDSFGVFLELNAAGGIFNFGYQNGVHIQDDTSNLYIQDATNIYLSIMPGVGDRKYQIGDIGGLNNGTNLLINDDTPEQIVATATNGIKITGDTVMIHTGTAWANGAAAAAGTLTNAPAAGNPTKWIPVDDNGTTRYIPSW